MPPMEPRNDNLLGLELQELTRLMSDLGQPSYRGRQLWEAIYRQRAISLEGITSLPLQLRSELGRRFCLELPAIDRRFKSVDGTVRYLIQFDDGQSVETVWMPEGDGGEAGDGSDPPEMDSEEAASSADTASAPKWKRATICISSQAGCAVNCQFCLTAKLGLVRNLSPGEIVGQVLVLLNEHNMSPPLDRVNLVFMGQGEPFHNYDSFMAAVRLLVSAVGIPESRMTVSTSGIVPRIEDFGREAVRPKLAISLNASHDEQRSPLMPLNRKWDIAELMEAARQFPLRPRERLTFEYVLLDQVNDSSEDARRVTRLIQGIRAKVNLIAWNPGPGIPFGSPAQERVLGFQEILTRSGIPTFIRRPRGRDIFAACGQLQQIVELAG
ncbi:MAG: 23S rRNA (adenine(2503)-C(2))-methyltransferase RlmN [Candidatus Korobacteraceae bacterium]